MRVTGSSPAAQRAVLPVCIIRGPRGIEVQVAVAASDQFTVQDDAVAVEGVDQAGQFREGVADLAAGAGADPNAPVEVHQRPPAVPLAFPGPCSLVVLGLAGGGQHG
jgi:hypothetical protein